MRHYIFRLIDILGINALCQFLNRRRAVILWYHGICDDDFDLLRGYDERHLPVSAFRQQLAYLKDKGYAFVSLTELTKALTSGEKVGKKVVLTFDDGFRNVVANAYPIIREYGARGCYYLVADLIGGDEPLWTDYVETVVRNQPLGEFAFSFKGEKVTYTLTDKKSYEHAMTDIKMKLRSIPDTERLEHLKQFGDIQKESIPEEFSLANWEEIKGLDPAVMEIGSHTRRHPNLTRLTTAAEVQDEIAGSKEAIEAKIGRAVAHFCYPAGAYDEGIIARVIESGYQSAVTISYGFIDEEADPYTLNRIEATASLELFKAHVSGSYNILKSITDILRNRKRQVT